MIALEPFQNAFRAAKGAFFGLKATLRRSLLPHQALRADA